VERFAGQDEGLKDAAHQALKSDPSDSAEDWVSVLLQ
jgi:hypothetical protein